MSRAGFTASRAIQNAIKLGILTPVIPDIVRCHMVLVLDVVPAKKGYVKIMTVSAGWVA